MKAEEVEVQGVDCITRFREYILLCKGKTKVPKDIDERKVPLQTHLLSDEIVFKGPCLRQVPLLKLEDWDLANHEKFPHLATE